MKRTLLLAALFIALGAGAFYALIYKKSQTGTSVSWDMDFAIENTNDVQKIFLADRNGTTATIERKGDHWMYNGRYKARPTAVSTLLETLTQLTVWYIPTKASQPVMVKSLATEGIKVVIYGKDNKVLKTYYVGGVTPDERGTYMIMENSEQPFVMHIPSFIGQLRVRYLLKEDDWRDRTIFSEDFEKIKSVSVEYPQQKSESFVLNKTGKADYAVHPFYSTTPPSKLPQRKGAAEAYLTQFSSLVSEGFETEYFQRDSVRQLVPFALVSLQRDNGEERKVRFWVQEIEYRRDNNKPYVVRYFAETEDNSFYLVQDHVFGPIFRSYSYFFEQGDKRRVPN
ncbi:MAG: DUF4340 domain-containing protein [Lewinellaceae bacterium]|nr:DUF4340 domain-containing protein [Lewinellaceae bacterium]